MKLRTVLSLLVAMTLLGACHAAETSTVVAAPTPVMTHPPVPPAPVVTSAALVSPSVQETPAQAVVPINDRHYGPAVARLLDSAQKSLRICLYQVRFYPDYPGSLSNQLVDKVILAKRRGVDVKVIIDTSPWKNNGEFDKENLSVADRLIKGGCKVYLDPPNIQSHQKMFVADDLVTVVASANWSHYSLSSNREVGVMIWSKPVADAYTAYFQKRLDQSSPYSPDVGKEEMKLQAKPANETELLTPEELVKAEGGLPVATDAKITTMNNREFFPRLDAALDAARHSITVVQDYAYWYATTPKSDRTPAPDATPRTSPSQTNLVFNDLVAAKKRGLNVRVVFDLTMYPEGGMRFSGEDFANRLWALGVPAYYDDPNVQIHAKMFVIDGDRSVIGSTNLSFQALEENNECSVLIDSKTLGTFYTKWADSIFAKAHPVVQQIETNPPKPVETRPPLLPPVK